jgi:hypothetical protein
MRGYFEGLEGLPTDLPKDLIPDFVGPGLDIGFRLAEQASQRRFVVSTDVIYMLAKTATSLDMRPDLIKIHFEGLQLLKGVLQGLEYPIFWIDMAQPDDIYSYGNDLQKRNLCRPGEVEGFMKQFYHQRHNYMYAPFIVSETEEILRDYPAWYYREHNKMLRKAGFQFAEELP